ncbi:MAG: type IV pilus modification protein PilV [Aquabacterium sp.]|nr:MAG: type IV pilus modification protein PilV [Aquabacterium sp.]
MTGTSALRRRRGLTLIEVLVTIVILSIGMLGIAGLQAATSKYKINSWARSATSMLLSDLADRVRANPVADDSDFIEKPSPTTPSPYLLSATWQDQQAAKKGSAAAGKDCAANNAQCTPAEQASYDMAEWRRLVGQMLPQGAGLVSGNRSNGYTVTLMWFDKGYLNATTNALVAAPRCNADLSGMAAQSCCPQASGAPAGVRCLNMTMVP